MHKGSDDIVTLRWKPLCRLRYEEVFHCWLNVCGTTFQENSVPFEGEKRANFKEKLYIKKD